VTQPLLGRDARREIENFGYQGLPAFLRVEVISERILSVKRRETRRFVNRKAGPVYRNCWVRLSVDDLQNVLLG
jgi:hypothetical protein